MAAMATTGCSDSAPRQAMNIIIPIGGFGSRFKAEGYRFPKPLINIQGRAMLFWLIDRLEFVPGDILWIPVREEICTTFDFPRLLKKEYPDLDTRIIPLHFDTRGAVETLYIATGYMTDQQLKRRTISLDCDTLYFADVLSMARELPPQFGAVVNFIDQGNLPVFSYVITDKDGLITEIQEKKAISNIANTGAYVFSSAATLRTCASQLLDGDTNQMDEFYSSSLISEMIAKKTPFMGIRISTSDFVCLGTPSQLREFQKTLHASPYCTTPRRFCFDLDSTLVTIPRVLGDYTTCDPIEKNIRLVRQLKESGHHIIIQTARRMSTHKGNLGAIIADVGKLTLNQLEAFSIPYDEIFFGEWLCSWTFLN
ncbi:hypothetical protein HDU83_002192 [Entophlyctis luteolus]|nr:hypothetical protein HDU83_002192 [Entophlyctis luteolus]